MNDIRADGAEYEGNFKRGEFHGKGKYIYPGNSKEYVGDFRKNMKEGTGTTTWYKIRFYLI